MKKILVVILTWLLIFSSCLLCSAQEWRDIILLKTTRKQVEKILDSQEETGSNDQVQFYALKEETILVVYYSKGSCAESEENEWNVAKDTVISLSIHPRKKTFLSSLSFDLSEFERIPGSGDRYLQFRNLKDGIGISVDEDSGESLVRNIQYFPSKAMDGYKCR